MKDETETMTNAREEGESQEDGNNWRVLSFSDSHKLAHVETFRT